MRQRLITVLPVLAGALLELTWTSPAWAHARPATTDPQTSARLDLAPAHIGIVYDAAIVPGQSSIVLMDSTGTLIATTTDPPAGPKSSSVVPSAPLVPGPYTVAWTSRDAADGHDAQGFYTFVVNGGPVGIVNGSAQAQAMAADLTATLTVGATEDGSSMLSVALDKTMGVERVRVRLSRPDLGEDLLTLNAAGDGTWLLNGNEVALPGPGTPPSSYGAPTSSTMRRRASPSRSTRAPARRSSRRRYPPPVPRPGMQRALR